MLPREPGAGLAHPAPAAPRSVQRFAGSIPKGRPEGVQMWAALPNAAWMQAKAQWQATPIGGRAHMVEAKDLKLKPHLAGPGGLAAIGPNQNRGTGKPLPWAFLKSKKMTPRSGGKGVKTPPNYIKMHLLNGRFGGAGTKDNLAMGSAKMNSAHDALFDSHIYQALRAGGEIPTLKVVAHYHPASAKLLTKPYKKAWKNTLLKLDCQATHKLAGVAKPPIAATVPETANLDTQFGWKGK